MSVVVLAVAGIVAARVILGPVANQGPIGSCLSANLDLNDPVPFTKVRFSGTVVGLAASGGGSRAAYLEAAVLREIRRAGEGLRIAEPQAAGASLLDQIDAISAVSGGSFAAGYFALNARKLLAAGADDPAWAEFLDKMAIPFRTRQWYGPSAWSPVAWGRSIFTDYNRGIAARDDYSAELFGSATLRDLPDRPALYINAFDVANHVRFVMSKAYVDAGYFQSRDWLRKLGEPQTLLTANDLTFTRIEPSSVLLSDAVRASSAFPIAYPNVALRHCGSGVAFQGRQIFLADGALADNSGLITLMSQLRAGLDTRTAGSSIVALYIDASVDRIDRNGTKFQRTNTEDRYAWRDTVAGHATESIFGAVALIQDLGWKLLEGSDIVTDQLTLNWPHRLAERTGACGAPGRTSWQNLFETGALAMRPLVIRLGLRDVIDPEFQLTYGAYLRGHPDLARLLADNRATEGLASLSKDFSRRLQGVPTDFTLAADDRRLLDLAAFLLVHGKLTGDIALWNDIRGRVAAGTASQLKCPI